MNIIVEDLPAYFLECIFVVRDDGMWLPTLVGFERGLQDWQNPHTTMFLLAAEQAACGVDRRMKMGVPTDLKQCRITHPLFHFLLLISAGVTSVRWPHTHPHGSRNGSSHAMLSETV